MNSQLHKLNLSDQQASGPLADVKILDLSRLVAGNFLSYHLADLGAEVIKVESPSSGDPLRAFAEGGISAYWKVFGRNKKSIAIDLKSPEGKQIVLDLVRNADALIENFKPGGLEKLGFSPETLHAINPKLVIVRISGWGQSGPYCQKPGFGTLIEAFSGFAAKSGFPDSGPLLPNLGLADMMTGLMGAYMLLAALRSVEVGATDSSGKGQVIDLSLLDSMNSFLGADPTLSQLTGQPIPRSGNVSALAAPRNIYIASDGGYVALSASMQSMAEKLFIAMGREDLITDERYHSNAARVQNRDSLDRIISDFTESRSLKDNLEFFETHGITAAAVNDSVTVLDDAHVIERQVFVAVDDPDLGSMAMPNIAAGFSETPGCIHALAPDIGEHTRATLAELEYSEERIEQLLQSGVVGEGG